MASHKYTSPCSWKLLPGMEIFNTSAEVDCSQAYWVQDAWVETVSQRQQAKMSSSSELFT